MILLLSPFAVGLFAGIIHKLPFAGSRHQMYLLPFLAAGFAAAITWIPRKFAVPLFLLAVIPALFWATRNPPDNDPHTMAIGDMTAALNYIDHAVPRAAPIFADAQTHYILGYHLGRNDSSMDATRLRQENDEILGGRRVVSPRPYVWAYGPDDAMALSSESARAIGVTDSDHLWIFSVAWMDTPLAARLLSGSVRNAREFGAISVIEAARQ